MTERIMKGKCNIVNIFLLIFFMTNAIQAFERVENYFTEQMPNSGKIEQMITNEQGVFLFVDGLWFGAEELQATAEGILVLQDGEWKSLAEVAGNNNYVWICPICGHTNVHTGLPCARAKYHPK